MEFGSIDDGQDGEVNSLGFVQITYIFTMEGGSFDEYHLTEFSRYFYWKEKQCYDSLNINKTF